MDLDTLQQTARGPYTVPYFSSFSIFTLNDGGVRLIAPTFLAAP